MPRPISPLLIRIQASGARQVKGDVREVAGSFDVVVESAGRADGAVKGVAGSAKELVIAGRGVERMGNVFDKMGNSAGAVTKKVAGARSELRGAEKDTRGIGERMADADKRTIELVGHVKQLRGHLKSVAGDAGEVKDVMDALRSGGPFKLLDAIAPLSIKSQIGLGLMAGGVGLSAMLGSTIKPAMEKETRMAAITGITGSRDVATDIYNTTDRASTSSVFNLPELVVAAKTLTKDRQFSTRLLKAADDLAAANKDEGVNPQDVARAMGRLRAGDAGEAFERLRDFGIGKPDLQAKGLKFDGGGALEDKSTAGIEKAIDAVTAIIEERFGGLSERLATTTLEGSVSNMEDAIGRFKTSIGESFIPVLNFGAQTIQSLVGWLNGLSPAAKTALAWGTMFTAGLLIVGGTFLFIVGSIAQLNAALVLSGMSANGLSMQLVTKLLPSMGMVALGIGLIAIAAWGFKTAYEGSVDAMTQSSAELEYHWGALGKFWVWAGDMLNTIWNHPLFRFVQNATGGGLTTLVGDRLGLGGGNSTGGDAAEKESLRIENARRKKRGLKPITKADQDAVGGREETVDDVRKREEAKAKRAAGGEALKEWQKKQAAIFAKMGAASGASGDGVMPSMSGGGAMGFGPNESKLRGEQSADVQAAQAKVDALQLEIQNLQDQKRNTTDKGLKKTLGDQIIARGRLLAAARRELAATKKLAGRAEKDAARMEKPGENSRDKVQDNDFEINKANVEDRYAGRTDALERALKAAKNVGDGVKIRRLTLEAGNLNAQKQLELELMDADREKDAAVRTSLRKKAQNAYRLARNAATRDANHAALDAEEERQNTVRRGNADARKVEMSILTDSQLAPLEESLESAKEAADFARIRSITLQIESLKAEQEYADAMTDATLEDNREKRKQLERLALIRKTGALAKAVYAADKAVRGAKKDGKDAEGDRGAREALARMNRATRGGGFGGNPLRPGGTMDNGVPSLANFGGDTMDLQRERTLKIQSMRQNGQGDWKIKIEEFTVPYAGIGDAEVN